MLKHLENSSSFDMTSWRSLWWTASCGASTSKTIVLFLTKLPAFDLTVLQCWFDQITLPFSSSFYQLTCLTWSFTVHVGPSLWPNGNVCVWALTKWLSFYQLTWFTWSFTARVALGFDQMTLLRHHRQSIHCLERLSCDRSHECWYTRTPNPQFPVVLVTYVISYWIMSLVNRFLS